MIISEDRQSHLAHLIIDGIWKDDLVDYTDDVKALKAAKKGISNFVTLEEEISQKAHKKVSSLKRNVIEGSSEWDVLYKKYYEEELKRSGHY